MTVTSRICAIASSLLNQIIENDIVVLGEVGLGGEIRPVAKLEQKLKEAERLGFTKAIVPATNYNSKKLKLFKINNLTEIVKYLVKK